MISNPTPLDVAASIDRVLRRNIQFPDQTFVAGNHAVTVLMRTLLGNASGGVINFNLPSAVGIAGMRFTFKKTDSSANAVGVNAAGLETIDGVASVTLNQPNQVVSIESDGANWKVVSNYVQATPGSVSGMLDIKGIQKTDNDFSTLNPVPGTTIVFNTTRAGFSFLAASAYTSGLSFGPYSATIGINVDGVDYTLALDAQNNGAGGDFTQGMGYSGSLPVFLNPGVHTAYVFVTQSVIGFQATPNNPLTLSVIFPTATGGVVAAATLVKQQSGPFSATVNPPDTNYIPIAGSSIPVVLAVPQTVTILAYTNFNDPGSNACNGQLAVRVTSPGPSVTDLEGNKTRGGNDVNAAGSVVSRAINLPAGSHTIELLARNPASGGTYEFENAWLTVIYNNPQEIAPTPEAATLVVHPTAGEGDFQTIEAALAELGVLGGGYILVREGTYTPPAGGYIMPNVPAVVRGCGDATIIDLGAAGDPAFVCGFVRKYVFEDLNVTGSAADVDRRVVEVTATAKVYLNRVTGSNLRRTISVPGAAAGEVHVDDCEFFLLDNAASLFVDANANADIQAKGTLCFGTNFKGGIAGGPFALLYYCTITAVNGIDIGPDSILTGCDIRGLAGEVVTLGNDVRVASCNFDSVLVSVTGNNVKFETCRFNGTATQDRCMDVTAAATGPQIIGCSFSGCDTDHIRTATIDTIIKGCHFFDNGSLVRGVDVLATAFRAVIEGNNFEFMTEAVRTASSNGIMTGNAGCKVVETGGANINVYANNTGFDASTIIGASSRIENNQVVGPISVDTTLDEFQRTVLVDAAGAARTITLPTAASAKWRKYIIKKTDASANTVTIDGDGAETIDGAATQVLAAQYDFIEIQSDGTQWWIV